MHEDNCGVYGIREMRAQLARKELLGASAQRSIPRCTTQRQTMMLGSARHLAG